MYFPIAGIEVSPIVPPLVAFGVSFFASMGGISGAFLLLPFQMSVLGYTSPSVSATNQFYNVVAIPSGVYRYIREKRMVWPLTLAVAAGTLPGVFIGAIVRVAWLPDPKLFKFFAAFVLLYIGLKLLKDMYGLKPGQKIGPQTELPPDFMARYEAEYGPLRGRAATQAGQGEDQPAARTAPAPGPTPAPRGIVSPPPPGNFVVDVKEFNLKRLAYTFQDQEYACPTLGVFLLSFTVGIIGGTYGIGGGAIIAPFFVTWFRLPVHTISGATLMGTFLTSVAGVAFYMAIAPFFPDKSVTPDWMLGLLFGLGGMAGMYLGARCQKRVPAPVIKWALAMVITGTAFRYFMEFFFK